MHFVRGSVVVSRSLVTRSRFSIPASARKHAFNRSLSTTLIRREEQQNTVPQVEPLKPKRSKFRTFIRVLGGATLFSIVAGIGSFVYVTQAERHPGIQLPYDTEKKTIVILGSGWGATSLLKTIDTAEYNVVIISPKNYFLFTPLLPSVALGTLSAKAILQPTRYVARHKARTVTVIEAEAKEVDPFNKTVTFEDDTEIKGDVSHTTIPYDYLVYAVGAEVQTFGIPGVQEKACFMKELVDAEVMQRRFKDCIESAAFPGQDAAEIDRLLHIFVVGGGPTGIEVSGEIHDFLEDDLKAWYPELAGRIRISLVEALPSVLPMFSKQLIDYTESTFKESKIDILTKTMVKEVKDRSVVLQMPDKSIQEVPCGMVVWAGGNKGRKITQDLMAKYSSIQTNRRGLTVDDHLRMAGPDGSIFAIGDCTSTSYAPTAQVASQQGAYLARVFAQMAKKESLETKLNQLQQSVDLEGCNGNCQLDGSLAYIGSDKAIADLPFANGNIASAGVATYLFWRSAYLSTLFSLRNRTLVANDWLITKDLRPDSPLILERLRWESGPTSIPNPEEVIPTLQKAQLGDSRIVKNRLKLSSLGERACGILSVRDGGGMDWPCQVYGQTYLLLCREDVDSDDEEYEEVDSDGILYTMDIFLNQGLQHPMTVILELIECFDNQQPVLTLLLRHTHRWRSFTDLTQGYMKDNSLCIVITSPQFLCLGRIGH
ncbi:FAD/NAD(P)-binding domain-containing protein [Gymnopus androsaceus JB14]|uniref:NADH:ubiquinone reductase (non-electrogenic) n=1 Tax=Gymnopus androsaceus JB14 TaxID=1447944 RepID=A0A6A4I1E6_9AGAR|nr:FAD/NAD(P)-binding domain-containing protein [Gymnopus androsaceus JB14]